MRVILAPDSFKGSASAAAAADAIASGWLSVRPDDTILRMPMADGGEGTLEAFLDSIPGAQRMPVGVDGPDGRHHDASWVLLPDGTGVVELAETSGITLMERLDPAHAQSRGFGQAIRAALDAGVDRLLLAVGGSASTDGGAGMLAALGARFTDSAGAPLSPGNAGLRAIEHADLDELPPLPPLGAVILSDVRSPLLGSDGSAAIFGPQKGADPDEVTALEAGLERFAALIPVDPTTPGSGAAGGVGFGLLAWGAVLRSGAEAVSELIGLDEAVASSDLVITGEGRFDGQSAEGKTVSAVLAAAGRSGTDAALIAGSVDAPTDQFVLALCLSELAGSPADARADASRWLQTAGASIAQLVTAQDTRPIAVGPRTTDRH